MPEEANVTNYSAMQVAGALTVVGAATLGAVNISGTLDSATNVTATGTLSGSTLHSGTGLIIGDNDGDGCTVFATLNGSAITYVTPCP